MSVGEITIRSREGKEFMAYCSRPDKGTHPGVVVLQAIFGVTSVIRAVCDRLAAEGFVALAPDLYWRQEAGVQLNDRIEDDRSRAFALYKAFDVDRAMEDVAAAATALGALPGCTGKVGTLGFCLGGRVAFLSAARTKVSAAISYYGVSLETHLNELPGCPLMLHIAAEDQYVPPSAQQQIHAALNSNRLATLLDYAGRAHTFAQLGGRHFHQESSDLANERSFAFLRQHLA